MPVLITMRVDDFQLPQLLHRGRRCKCRGGKSDPGCSPGFPRRTRTNRDSRSRCWSSCWCCPPLESPPRRHPAGTAQRPGGLRPGARVMDDAPAWRCARGRGDQLAGPDRPAAGRAAARVAGCEHWFGRAHALRDRGPASTGSGRSLGSWASCRARSASCRASCLAVAASGEVVSAVCGLRLAQPISWRCCASPSCLRRARILYLLMRLCTAIPSAPLNPPMLWFYGIGGTLALGNPAGLAHRACLALLSRDSGDFCEAELFNSGPAPSAPAGSDRCACLPRGLFYPDPS